MVPRGIADIVQVVVLAPGPNAFLRRGGPRIGPLLRPGEHVLELHHATVGEQQRRVVARHQRRGRNGGVAIADEVIEEGSADVVAAGHDVAGIPHAGGLGQRRPSPLTTLHVGSCYPDARSFRLSIASSSDDTIPATAAPITMVITGTSSETSRADAEPGLLLVDLRRPQRHRAELRRLLAQPQQVDRAQRHHPRLRQGCRQPGAALGRPAGRLHRRLPARLPIASATMPSAAISGTPLVSSVPSVRVKRAATTSRASPPTTGSRSSSRSATSRGAGPLQRLPHRHPARISSSSTQSP